MARGDAGRDSDVDVVLDFVSDAEPSLFGMARLKGEIGEALGRRVDLGERLAMKPEVAAAAERDLVRVF